MKGKLIDLKEVVCCMKKLQEKSKMGICITLSDIERIPKILRKKKVNK